MKLIDKLVKLANKEEIKPFIIKGDKDTIYFEKDGYLYQRYENSDGICDWVISKNWLNCEVEIIEEDKKIEKLVIKSVEDSEHFEMKVKINELIDEVNKLRKEKANE